MKYLFLLFSAMLAFSCENNSFDSDKRQLIAKAEVREKLKNIEAFDVKNFKEDTLDQWPGSTFKKPIRYTLQVEYKDSTDALQNKEAFVIFTPDGKSVVSSQINN